MTPDLIERATKAIDMFDAICNIHDPSVSAHDRRVRAMAKVLEAAPSPSPAPGVVEALKQATDRFEEIRLILVHHLHEPERSAFWKAVDGRTKCQAALASLSQPAKGEREGGGVEPFDDKWLGDGDSVHVSPTPANPAQGVNEENRHLLLRMLSAFEQSYVGQKATVEAARELRAANRLVARLTAAIGAGGQAVAQFLPTEDGEFNGDEYEDELTPEDIARIDAAWETHKAALPVAVIVDDNQQGRRAIIEITVDPPTLGVGTKLYAEPKAVTITNPSPSEQAVAVKAGWRMVPEEPTKEMIRQLERGEQDGYRQVWLDVLSAAPQPKGE